MRQKDAEFIYRYFATMVVVATVVLMLLGEWVQAFCCLGPSATSLYLWMRLKNRGSVTKVKNDE